MSGEHKPQIDDQQAAAVSGEQQPQPDNQEAAAMSGEQQPRPDNQAAAAVSGDPTQTEANKNAADEAAYCPQRLQGILSKAVRRGDPVSIQYALEHNVDPNFKDSNHQTTLFYAAARGDAAVVEKLLTYGAAVDVRDINGQTVLDYAVKVVGKEFPADEQVQTVRLLLGKENEEGVREAPVCNQSNDGKTVLFTAVTSKSPLEVIKELLAADGQLLNMTDNIGQSALFFAATQDTTDTLNLLIEHQADLTILDTFGSTALHWAAFRNKPACCRYLIDEGTLDPFVKNKSNLSAADYAFQPGRDATAALFRELGIQPFSPPPAKGVKHGQQQSELQTPPKKRGRFAQPASQASTGPIEENIQALACAVSRPLTEKERRKAEEKAIAEAAQAKVEAILSQGSTLDQPGPDGLPPLCAAGLQGDCAYMLALLTAKANPAVVNPTDRRNALHFIILGAQARAQQKTPGQVEHKRILVKFLAHFVRDGRADPNLPDSEGRSAIKMAADTKWWEMKNKLTDWSQKRVSDNERARIESHQPFIQRMKYLSENIRDCLLETIQTYFKDDDVSQWGIIFKEHCEAGRAPKVLSPPLLHQAAANQTEDRLKICEWLVDVAKFDVNSKVRQTGETALFSAAEKGADDVASFLVARNANVNHVDSGLHMTPLFTAIRFKHMPVVRILISNGANVNHKDRNQTQPLHVAVAHKFDAVVPELVAAKANVDCRDKKGVSPLQMAIQNSRANLAHRLLTEFGAKALYAAKSNQEANTNLIDMARERGLFEIVDDLTVVQERQIAEFKWCDRVVNMPLEELKRDLAAGMNPNAIGPEGLRPLHRAAQRKIGDAAEACRILIEDYNANVHLVCNKGETAIFHMINSNLLDTIKLMVSKGASITYTSEEKLTPLCVALLCERSDIARYFISQGADVFAIDLAQRNLMHVCRDALVGRLLMDKGVTNLEHRNKVKQTPLFSACIKNNIFMIKFLLDRGADPRAKDSHGKCALHHATSAKAIKELLDKDPGLVHMVDKKEENALFARIADPNCKIETISALIHAGVSYTAKNKKKMTPLIYAIKGPHKNHWLPMVSEIVRHSPETGPDQLEEARKIANRTRTCPFDIQCYMNQLGDMMGEKKAEKWIRDKGFKLGIYYLNQIGLDEKSGYGPNDKAWMRALRHARHDFPEYATQTFGEKRIIEDYIGYDPSYKYGRVDELIEDWGQIERAAKEMMWADDKAFKEAAAREAAALAAKHQASSAAAAAAGTGAAAASTPTTTTPAAPATPAAPSATPAAPAAAPAAAAAAAAATGAGASGSRSRTAVAAGQTGSRSRTRSRSRSRGSRSGSSSYEQKIPAGKKVCDMML